MDKPLKNTHPPLNDDEVEEEGDEGKGEEGVGGLLDVSASTLGSGNPSYVSNKTNKTEDTAGTLLYLSFFHTFAQYL